MAAAREDQASIAALGSSLRANVKDWDGNTDAIERTIKARQDLGFTDDEQRSSLARLLPVYKNVNKALEVQRAAMDLARFKKIDLAEATTSLITIEGGQYRGLKQLIGSTKDISNATEALAAVRKAAGNAAADLAETDEGKLLAAQIRQGEALEKLGYILMPAFTEATVIAADIAEDLAGNLDGVAKAADGLGGVFEKLGVEQKGVADSGFDVVHAGQDLLAVMNPTRVSATLGVFLDTADKIGVSTDAARDSLAGFGLEVTTQFSTINQLADRGADNMSHASDVIVTATDDVGDASKDMATDVKGSAHIVTTTWAEMKKAVVDAARDIIDRAFGPIIAQDRLAATEAEIAAQRRIIASASSSKAEIRDARARLHELGQDNAQYLVELAEAGKTNSKAYQDGIKELKRQIKNAKGPAKAALQEVLDKIHEIERAGKNVPVNINVSIASAGNKERAEGGPVRKGEAYVVGERRAELFVPETDGRILPRVPSLTSMSAMSAGGGGDTIQVNLLDRMPARSVRDIGDGLRMLERRGYLRRRDRRVD